MAPIAAQFLDSMKGLGVGFGAAFLLGMNKADAAADAGVKVKSTNPAIDHIVEEGQAQQPHDTTEGADPNMQVAQYFRVYRRGYRRYYRRYRPLLPPRLSPLLPSWLSALLCAFYGSADRAYPVPRTVCDRGTARASVPRRLFA